MRSLHAKTFYETLFDLQLEPLPANEGMEMWCFPILDEAPGISGAIVKMDGVSGGTNSTLLYFSCEDCEVQPAIDSQAWWPNSAAQIFYRPAWLYILGARSSEQYDWPAFQGLKN